MMNNYDIADNFSLLAKLIDIHGDNSFKAKSYSSAAFAIEKLTVQLSSLPHEQIYKVKGIGDSIGKSVIEQLETGTLTALLEYISKTPPGILEMMNIKGIGPKKIATIWKELEIESLGELLYACNENRLTLYKGFGEKSQNNIKDAITFYMGTIGSYLYQQIETYALSMHQKIDNAFENSFLLTGEFRRQFEVIHQLEWVTDETAEKLKQFFTENNYTLNQDETDFLEFKGEENVKLCFHLCATNQLYSKLFQTSCSKDFLIEWNGTTYWDSSLAYSSEEEIFSKANTAYIPAYLRENKTIINTALHNNLATVIQPENITGIIHSHSNWSDGSNTIEEMAKAAIDKGLQYLVISDHSKTAFYAKGLQEDRLMAQHLQIDELNRKLAPFEIFKSIESDILNDGNLDYADSVLNSFDLVIASIHSNLKMSEEKAMSRLLKAIENPFTSILGHMTGRLLLSRNGYPVNHEKIIDACAANNVVIELNAHPRRLDIDWRWIEKALEKNILISINPDAHSIEGYDDCKYGILVAQKAGLTKEQNLSSFSLEQFEQFVQSQKSKRPL
jgi:DNA polymerase (family 10)